MKFPTFLKKTDKDGAPMSMRAKLGWILVGMAVLVGYGIFRHFYAQDDTLFELNRTFVILFLLWLPPAGRRKKKSRATTLSSTSLTKKNTAPKK